MSRATARGVFFTGPEQVELREFAVEPAPGLLEVRSALSAISHGTELLAYTGRLPAVAEGETLPALQGEYSYPFLYGYMNAGYLQDGRKVFAFRPHQDLFFAAEDELIPIPDKTSLEDAVLLPSLETALGIVHDSGLRYREQVAVVGLGVIGLLTAELLLRAGAASVTAIDPSPMRRDYAAKLGCSVVPPGSDLVSQVEEFTEGRGFDLAINTSGSAEGLQSCIESVSLEAKVVEASWYGCTKTSLRLGGSFHRKRIRIQSSQVSHISAELSSRWDKARRMSQVLELLPIIRPSRYITDRFSLDRAPEAFQRITETSSVLQVVLTTEE